MTFIIAEIGSNHSNFGEASESISIAKNCGADAAKFQLFSEHDLYGSGSKDYNIDPKDLVKLKEKADACGIEFMCTAFSQDGYDIVNPLVKRHKIASSESNHPFLLNYVASFAKPVIVSFGASSTTDIEIAITYLGSGDITALYCVSDYPAKNVNLYGINKLKTILGGRCAVGYSCHTKDWYTPAAAVHGHGAMVIEKHFKLKEMNTPDNDHALLPEDFKKMVKAIRGNPLDYIAFPDAQEKDAVELYNRRLVASKDIKAGEVLDPGSNIGIYRTRTRDREGLSPFAIFRLAGKLAVKDIKALEPIGPGMFQ